MVASPNRVLAQLTGATGKKQRTPKPSDKRETLRESLWPGSSEEIWSRTDNDGFTTIPRLLSLVLTLIEQLAPKGNPARVYMSLWARNYDEGIITIKDAEEFAFESGYTGSRAIRTWREHLFALAELGFVRILPDGNREYGHVLVLNPLQICVNLNAAKKVPPEWWSAFVRRAGDIGAVLPSVQKTTSAKAS